MCSDKFWYKVQELREKFKNVALSNILKEKYDDDLLICLDNFIIERKSNRNLYINVLIAPKVSKKLLKDENAWEIISDFCIRRYNEDIKTPYILLDTLVLIFQPNHIGIWIDKEIVFKSESFLEIDKKGLIIGPSNHIQYNKEGFFTEKYWITYDVSLPGVGLSGGFIEKLISTKNQLNCTKFGVAINPDMILTKEHHLDVTTLAYIRGPKGISKDKLNDPLFPKNASGTVTVHERTDDNPKLQFFQLHRIEVMWSKRKNLKSVQIEELVGIDNYFSCSKRFVKNRYLHSQWDSDKEKIIHLDGAIRYYDKNKYHQRLNVDIRKYTEKADGYKKLFRIDADLSISVWADLVVRFFQENELVLEYFGGPKL